MRVYGLHGRHCELGVKIASSLNRVVNILQDTEVHRGSLIMRTVGWQGNKCSFQPQMVCFMGEARLEAGDGG